MIHQRTIPAPYLPRPAGRPSAAARPGDKVGKKPAFSLDKYDWRAEVSLGSSPRSLPGTNSGIALLRAQAEGIVGVASARTMEDEGVLRGVEVGLEELIQGGKGKREKRTTTATALGFDFISNPTIIPLPDATPATVVALPPPAHPEEEINLSTTPRTPALDPAQDDEDEDDWERISSFSDGQRGQDEDDDNDMIVLGELELEDAAEQQQTGVTKLGKIAAGSAKQRAKKDKAGKEKRTTLSYAAMLGRTA